MIQELTKSAELFERRKNVVANGVGVFNRATVSHAKGAIITEVDGRELIDFAGGIGVVNAGHCPDPVVEAIREQAGKYIHTSFNVVTYEPYIKLCEELVEILPHGDNTKAMLVSTGAEAVENAIKIARQATKRQGILCFSDAYHGRTRMAMSLTSKVSYKIDCGPFAPEVYRLPFPNFYRKSNGRNMEEFVQDELNLLHESTLNLVDINNLAAIIIEPIQGEGGFNPVPKEYLQGLRKFCDEIGDGHDDIFWKVEAIPSFLQVADTYYLGDFFDKKFETNDEIVLCYLDYFKQKIQELQEEQIFIVFDLADQYVGGLFVANGKKGLIKVEYSYNKEIKGWSVNRESIKNQVKENRNHFEIDQEWLLSKEAVVDALNWSIEKIKRN